MSYGFSLTVAASPILSPSLPLLSLSLPLFPFNHLLPPFLFLILPFSPSFSAILRLL